MSDRYCINEWYIVEPITGDQHWLYFYSDGSYETLTLRKK